MKERGGDKLMSRRYSLGKNVSLGGWVQCAKKCHDVWKRSSKKIMSFYVTIHQSQVK